MQLSPEELGTFCELIGIASLCSWTVCLVVGLGLCAPDRALLMGVPGTLLGGVLFETLGWPPGPAVDGYPVIPALVGTTLVLAVTAYVMRLRDELRTRRDVEERQRSLRPFRDWSAAHHRARG